MACGPLTPWLWNTRLSSKSEILPSKRMDDNWQCGPLTPWLWNTRLSSKSEILPSKRMDDNWQDPEIKRDELRRERKERFSERQNELDEIKSDRDKASRNREAAEKAYYDNQSEITTIKKQVENFDDQMEDLREQSRQTSTKYDEIQRDTNGLEDEELTIRIAGYDRRRQGATTDRAAASAGGNNEKQIVLPEKKTARGHILEEMKKKAYEQLGEASCKTSQLVDDLNKAESEEERLMKRHEDKQEDIDNMKDCDQSKHAEIQVYIQQNLVSRDINLLLNYLDIRNAVTRCKREDLRDFFDIWQYLSSLKVPQGGIEVGDLRNIRKYLSEALEDSKNLVKEIEKMEDALLGEYRNGKTPMLIFENDTQSKQMKSFSQMVFSNIKQEKYNDHGGPYKHLYDVLVVVRLYLAHLNRTDTSEVTDALHDFVKTGLEQSDILTLAECHMSCLWEHKSGKGIIRPLEKDIKERNTKIEELKQNMNTVIENHKKEEKSWWNIIPLVMNNTREVKEDYEKKKHVYDDEKRMKELMGERQLGDTRFENREEERNALCMERMQSNIEQMREMMVKQAEELQAFHEEHTNSVATLQHSFEKKATWDMRYHRKEMNDDRAMREEYMDPEEQREELRQKRKKRLDERQKELDDIELLRDEALRKREAAQKAYDKNQSEITTLTQQNDRIEDLWQQSRRTSARNQLKGNDTAHLKETGAEKERKKEDMESEGVSLQQTAILEEMKANADEQLLRAMSKTNELSDELNRAKSKMDTLEKRKKEIKPELKSMIDCDNAKHAKIMTHIHAHLVKEEIKLLLDYLEARVIIKPRKREEMHGDFFKIWQHLTCLEVADGGIAVGNLWKLRQYLSEALENSTNLVKEIEKREDELLRQYQQGNTPNQDSPIFSSD